INAASIEVTIAPSAKVSRPTSSTSRSDFVRLLGHAPMLPRPACKNLAIGLQWCFRRPVEITVLGPLELRIDGMAVPLGGPKPRVLLAMLALHANEVVSRDRLIEALWGDRPPPSVDQSLDTYVSRLRRVLGN